MLQRWECHNRLAVSLWLLKLFQKASTKPSVPFFIEASPVGNIDASHFYPSNLEAAALMNWDFWYSSKNTARLCGMHRCCRSESYCQLSLLLSQSTDEVNHLSATGWWVSDHRHLSSTIHACSKGMASLLPLRRFAEG